ncbi:hypothetical protein JCM1841_001637 [Sporobolomyces salmonicolor]
MSSERDGISGTSDSASPNPTSPYSPPLDPQYPSSSLSRSLPPGASYAPTNLHRPDQLSSTAASSFPGPILSITTPSAGGGGWTMSGASSAPGGRRGAEAGGAGPVGERAPSSAAKLETVAEGGSASGSSGQGQAPSAMLELPSLFSPSDEPLVASNEWPTASSRTHRQASYPTPAPSPAPASADAETSPATLLRPLPTPPIATSSPPAGSLSSTSRSLAQQPQPQPSYQLPSPSFTGIPNGRLLQASPSSSPSLSPSPAQRQTQSAHFPSFVPAAAFSAEDRGPYPPHVRSYSTNSAGLLGLGSGSGGGFRGGAGWSGPATGGGEAGAGVGDESELLLDSPQPPRQRQSLGDTAEPGRAPTPSSSSSAVAPSPVDRPGSFVLDHLPSDMAGIGRNSILLAASTSSPPLSPNNPPLLALSSPPHPQQSPTSPPLQLAPQPRLSPQPQSQPSQNPFPQQAQIPPHLIPQPEVCVECMMRDRDMADVDVTGAGVWERESDAEWREQCRWEEESLEGGGGSGERAGSQESAGGTKRRGSGAAWSRESSGRGTSGSGGEKRKRLGRGQALTSGNLKVWTSMNPPAAAHRWRTLQKFLATQIHLVELERQSRDAALNEQRLRQSATGSSSHPSVRSRSSIVLPDRRSTASLFPPSLQQANPSHPHAYPQQQQYNHPSLASSGASIRSYSYGDQPWLANQPRRFSSPGLKDNSPPKSPAASSSSMRFGMPKFARSTSDLRSIGSPRSISPARTSLNVDAYSYQEREQDRDRRRSSSLWSRFRQSASASVLSFAPSASMMDMHLGLSQDKHAHMPGYPYGHGGGRGQAPYETYPSMSDPAVARHAEQRERDRAMNASVRSEVTAEGGGKKKKKGIKGFFNKLVGGNAGGGAGGAKSRNALSSASAPATPSGELPFRPAPGGGPFDDDELAPPPPLSALANEPRYHQRSASNSSVDSFSGPYTPPLHPTNFRASSYTVAFPAASNGNGNGNGNGHLPPSSSNPNPAADRHSILTVGSYTSTRSRAPTTAARSGGRNSLGRPSLDSLGDAAGGGAGEPEILVDDNGDGAAAGVGGYPAYPQPRLQKSLPSLPSEAAIQHAHQRLPPPSAHDGPFPSYHPPPPDASAAYPYAHYSGGASRSAYSLAQIPSRGMSPPLDATVGRGAGKQPHKVRSKVFSAYFGGFGKKKTGAGAQDEREGQGARAASMDAALNLGVEGYGSIGRRGAGAGAGAGAGIGAATRPGDGGLVTVRY